MGWRTVVVTKSSKLDLSLGYMLVRDAESTKRLFLNEISVLIIESTAVSLTAALLCELMKQKIKVIFCDEKHNPGAELVPYNGSHDSSRRIKQQAAWSRQTKMLVWTYIVREKIKNQAFVLSKLGLDTQAQMLLGYIDELELFDATNREGHAAKVYFNAVFGMDFTRESDDAVNSALNYGYSILLSCFNREVVSNGCITQLGLFHDNIFNQFNLSCDLMEPFRPFVDMYVFHMNPEVFESAQKHQLLGFLSEDCYIAGHKQSIQNAVSVYTRSVLSALDDDDVNKVDFPVYEL